MEFLILFGDTILKSASGVASVLAIGQFAYGVFNNRKDISEIKERAIEEELEVFSNKKDKARFKPVYQVLEKATPHAQRVIVTLQLRAAIFLVLVILAMFGILYGIGGLGNVITNNPKYSISLFVAFVIIINLWIPKLSNDLGLVKDKLLINLSDKSLSKEEIVAGFKGMQDQSTSYLRKFLRRIGIIPLSPQEMSFLSTYLGTLEIVRSIESEYLKNEMNEQQTTLVEWVNDVWSNHNNIS